MVKRPPRCSATGVSPSAGTRGPSAVGEVVEHAHVERRVRDRELRIETRIDWQGIALHATHHEPAAGRSEVGRGVDDARDRLVGRHAGDRLGDEELVADRRDRYVDASQGANLARPGTGSIDDERRGDLSARRLDTGNLAVRRRECP